MCLLIKGSFLHHSFLLTHNLLRYDQHSNNVHFIYLDSQAQPTPPQWVSQSRTTTPSPSTKRHRTDRCHAISNASAAASSRTPKPSRESGSVSLHRPLSITLADVCTDYSVEDLKDEIAKKGNGYNATKQAYIACMQCVGNQVTEVRMSVSKSSDSSVRFLPGGS